jgi:hypothetical protein
MDGEQIIGWGIVAILFFVVVIALESSKGALENPSNKDVVYISQIREVAKLAGSGYWLVTIYRQSGNIHDQYEVAGSASNAIDLVLATFRRAQIDAVALSKNTEKNIHITRLFYNHRGRNEGKKVGEAKIEWVR